MKTTRRTRSAPAPSAELVELRLRLAEAEETLRAIRTGEVDAVVITREHGPQFFTLEGAERAYRVLIESMNEGALTLTADKTILYANQCFARMVKCPLEQLIGSSFRRLLSVKDQARLKPLMEKRGESGAKIQAQLNADDGSHLPVQISVQVLAKDSYHQTTIGMVVTDMSEARRNEELMRALTHRVVQVQEAERASVALELHDHITQLLCAILFRCQALVDALSTRGQPLLRDAIRVREMLTKSVEEVERISRDLRPGILDQLGLGAVLSATAREFEDRTGMPVILESEELAERLPADLELALYRILQEALKNVERHARARRVTVALTKSGDGVLLKIADDGVGFDPDGRPVRRKTTGGLGLLSMRERAAYVGGTLTIKSIPSEGTEITVFAPVPAGAAAVSAG